MSLNDFLIFDDRPSDSPFVERVWRSHSTRAGSFLSVAASYCGIPRGKFLRHFALKGRTTSLRHLRELVIQSVIDGLASLILLTIAAVIIHRKSCGNPYEDDEQFERDL